ncbi:MAG: vWA domain-containing protein [Pseudomonadota bacterium]
MRRTAARVLRSLLTITFGVAATTATAQEDAILVLDASGSMWGQIDGEAKIVTARRVIGDLVTEMPGDRALGLVAYGHNRESDCTDIEVVAPLGTDRKALKNAVDGLKPKGKTPLSAAVQFAANELKYTENKATVILVSDGIENCDLDPCKVGASLENLGVDFTAHVIGFDIGETQDAVQLRCLAENTGGRYIGADNAGELARALVDTVAKNPPPESLQTTALRLRATENAGGPLIESGLTWRVQQSAGGDVVFDATDAGETEAELAPGTYDVFVNRPSDQLSGQLERITVRRGTEKTVTIPLAMSFEATLDVRVDGDAPVSSEFTVYWTGPDRRSDYITLTTPDAPDNSYTNYAYTQRGSPLTLRLPVEPGDYEVRYVLAQPPTVLARAPVRAVEVEAELTAAETVAAGSNFAIEWRGPGYSDDWITIVKPDADDRSYTSYAYTNRGSPVSVTAPLEAGEYELRYLQAGRKIIARRPITVEAVLASVSGPATAVAGTYPDIVWTGPALGGDWITIVKPDAADRRYTSYAYTNRGSPVSLRMPLEAGDYELRYVQSGRKVIARQPVSITAATAALDAPSQPTVGSTVSVAWTGPGAKNDFVAIAKLDHAENRYINYAYARNGSPAELKMPVEPGDYEYRYTLDGRKVIARVPVTVIDVEATVSAPLQVQANANFEVTWTGPANYRDYVTIAERDARPNRYLSYKYTRNGSPATLKAPAEGGDFEIRYVLDGTRVVATQPIVVSAPGDN